MGKIKLTGMEDVERMLSALGDQAEEAAEKMLYEGAGVMADAIKAGIQSLPVVEGWGTPSKPLPGGVSAYQKEGLLRGFGIAGFRKSLGDVNTRLGFDGYNGLKTKKFPQGQPNALIARAAESGTSWKRKSPFFRTAVNRARSPATEKMKQVFDEEMKRVIK